MSEEKKSGFHFFAKKAVEPGLAGKDVRRRWMIVGVALVGVVVAASMLFRSEPLPPATSKKADPKVVDITPKPLDRKQWEAQSQTEIKALRESLTEEIERRKSLEGKLDQLLKSKSQALPPSVVPPPVPPGEQPNQTALPPVTPVPPPPLPVLKDTKPALPVPSAEDTEQAKPFHFSPPAKPKSEGEDVKAKVKYEKNKFSGFLPAGSFAPVALLHGLDAGTSVANQSNPQPILLRVQDHAQLPGAAKYRLKSCFVIASGYGDLSAERVYARTAQLSCVDKDDRLVLTSPLQGYLVDSDGKLGLRGTVIDRQGAKLGKAMLAGFAQGLATAFGAAQQSVTTSALGTVSTVGGSDALKASGLTGASTAAQQLAQFYLKEAQSMFPVISVDGGRIGSIVITQGLSLTWGNVDAQFTREVKPE